MATNEPILCENCGKEITNVGLKVEKVEGGGTQPYRWCMNCVRKELHGGSGN